MELARLGPSVKLWSTCYDIISFTFIQSAYRKLHSTETVLIRADNGIAIALDQKRSVILLLVDLSEAFDTVDHCILLSHLSRRLLLLLLLLLLLFPIRTTSDVCSLLRKIICPIKNQSGCTSIAPSFPAFYILSLRGLLSCQL